MIPYLGYICLFLAMLLSAAQFFLFVNSKGFEQYKIFSIGCFALVSAAFACLLYAHITSDFSVLNVYENSHTAKPLIYKISGAWGNHEGSMLLFIWLLSLYLFLFVIKTPEGKLAYKVASLESAIISGFSAFSIFTSNPFARIFPAPLNGKGLNPLLQDIGLAIHPPILYLGYTGLSLALAFAVVALLENRITRFWIRNIKKWVVVSWCFLTIGIMLGSWWAYRELGWGGFWFWDPVENSSLMPWLIATALYHSILVLQKRDALQFWVIFLSILSFSLSIVGFFLVRSGILTSVHSFASDPARGIFILLLLFAISGGAFLIFGLRAYKIKPNGIFETISKETTLLLNNLLLVVLCAIIFLGTLYPIALQVLAGEAVTVGGPYYYYTFLPIALLVLFFAGTGPLVKWYREPAFNMVKFLLPLAATLIIGSMVYLAFKLEFNMAFFGILFGIWLFIATFYSFYKRSKFKNFRQPKFFYGMILGHLGLAVLAIGISAAAGYNTEKQTVLPLHGKINFAGYDIEFLDVKLATAENYFSRIGLFKINIGALQVATLKPETRFFPIEQDKTTEAAIYDDLFSDLYIVIGDPMPEDPNSFAIRMYHRPLIGFIWLGALMIAAGGIVSLVGMRKKYED